MSRQDWNVSQAASWLIRAATLMGVLFCASQSESSRAIINPHDFAYVINNPRLCRTAGDDVYLLIWVHSAPANFMKRLLIRETWGNPSNFRDLNVRTAFFMGDPRNKTIQALLNYESETYGDIIQKDFIDVYRNLTYKAIAGFKWSYTYCSHAKIVLKADDDLVVDIFRLVRHLRTLQDQGVARHQTILCDVWIGRPVVRDPTSKWAVTKEEYAEDVYPPYCPGLAVLMTPDLMQPFYEESLYTRFFWVDDVYFSGLLPRRFNVTYHPLTTLTSFNVVTPDNYLSLESDYVFVHVRNKDLILYMWKKILAQHLERRADASSSSR